VTDVAQFRYRAFLSYSHRDTAWAKWLHAALERYRIDRDLVGRETPVGPVPKSLRPIFRDREEFSAGHSLSDQTLAALEASHFMIVLCSPAAAQSHYVNEEVRRFKALGRSERVIPVIVDGSAGGTIQECFPPALRFGIRPNGELTEKPEEPIAADARPEGDGKQIARQKTIAGLLGVQLDEIVRRADRARKRRNIFWGAVAGVFLLLTIAASGSAIYAYQKLVQSEERLDSAIEIAYGFVAEATAVSDRFGVPVDVSLALLKRGEAALNALINRGADSNSLRYRKALMLLTLSNSYHDLGRTKEALLRSVEARDLLKELVASDPRRRDWRLSLVDAEIYTGVWLEIGRQLVAALESYRNGLAIGEQLLRDEPTNVDVVPSLARLHVNLGNVQSARGLISEAMKSFTNSLDVMLQFAKQDGDSDPWEALKNYPSLNYMVVEATLKLSELNRARGSFAIAIDYYAKMLPFREEAAASDPESISLQLEVQDSHLNLGNALLDAGSIERALSTFRRGLSIAERLSASDPKTIAYKRQVALLKDGVGRALLAQGTLNAALNTFRENFESAKFFIESNPADLIWRSYLGIGHQRIGDALLAQGDFSGALKEYDAEASILEKLVRESLDDVEMQMQLAVNRFKRGDALFRHARTKEAVKSLEDSLAFWRDHATTHIHFVEYQAYSLQTLWRIAEIKRDMAGVGKARSGLAGLVAREMLAYHQKKWLEDAEKGTVALELDCSDREPDRAIVNCTKLIGSSRGDDKKLAQAYQLRGEAYRAKKQFESAITDFTEAIRADPSYTIAYNNRGLSYQELARFHQAIADFDTAIQLEPKFAIAYSNRALALERIGQQEQAIVDLSEAIRLDPDNALSRFNRGMSYLNLGSFDNAVLDFSEVIRLRPQLAIGYLHRGAAYNGKGQLDKGIADLTEAIRLEPGSAVYNLRGVAFFGMDQFERSLNDFDEAIRLDPGSAIAYTNRGRAYERQGRFNEAIVQHDTAIRLDPKLAIAYANRGLAHEGAGEYVEALADFEKALVIEPKLDRALDGRDRIQASRVTVR
jgi:tetratricopeptide (TPR) repeat protein